MTSASDGGTDGLMNVAFAAACTPAGRDKLGPILVPLLAALDVTVCVAGSRGPVPGSRAPLVADIKRSVADAGPALAAAHAIVRDAAVAGSDAVALVTAMDRPLGRAVGETLELEETIYAITGEAPPDLMSLAYAHGAELLMLAGGAPDHDAACRALEVAVSSGRAAAAFRALLDRLGENSGMVDDPAVLPQAESCELFDAPRSGFVAHVRPAPLARAAPRMGRPSAGFVVTARPGDRVERGEPIATIFARDADGVALGRRALGRALEIADEADPPLPLVSHRVTPAGAARYVW